MSRIAVHLAVCTTGIALSCSGLEQLNAELRTEPCLNREDLLDPIVQSQGADGSWSVHPPGADGEYAGDVGNEVGITGLCLLALSRSAAIELRATELEVSAARAATSWLIESQSETGSLALDFGQYSQFHNHCFALAGLIAWSSVEDKELAVRIDTAIDLGVKWIEEYGLAKGSIWRGRGFEESLVFGLVGSLLFQSKSVAPIARARLARMYSEVDPPDRLASGVLPRISTSMGEGGVAQIGLSAGSNVPDTTPGDAQLALWASADVVLNDANLGAASLEHAMRASAAGSLPPGERDLLACALIAVSLHPILERESSIARSWAQRMLREVLCDSRWIKVEGGSDLLRPDGIFGEECGAIGTTALVSLIHSAVHSSP